MKPASIGKLPLPNFFMIGAAKSGTTALWHAVRQHPDIFLSPVKEPCFFLSGGRAPSHAGHGWDFLRSVGVWRPGEYAKLFASSVGRRAIGEASTPYLTSVDASKRIHAKLPDSRIIAVLRQPADRAYSHFNFWRKWQVEPESGFLAALVDQDHRQATGWFPDLLYQWSGRYHAHLQSWFSLFPQERIRVFLYEDWQQQPRQILSELFRFLEVDDGFEPVLESRNVTQLPRVAWLHRLAKDPWWKHSTGTSCLQAARQRTHEHIRSADVRFNRVKPPPLDPTLRSELTRTYRDDILKLEHLLDRDLSHWLAGT